MIFLPSIAFRFKKLEEDLQSCLNHNNNLFIKSMDIANSLDYLTGNNIEN